MANFDLGEELKKVFLAGVGAVASTAEKSKELVDGLVEKGELTVEQGKVMNEELKRNIKDKLKENVTVVLKDDDPTVDKVINNLDKMSAEDLKAVKDRIAQMERENADDAEVKEAE